MTPVHVVAAAALIRRGDSVLLVRTERRGWEWTGGQIEEGEGLVDGVLREVAEESHVQARVDTLAAVYSNLSASRVIFDFLGTWVAGGPSGSDETLEARWVQSDEALGMVTEPFYRDRLEHLLAFDGRVRYQAYTRDPYHVEQERYL